MPKASPGSDQHLSVNTQGKPSQPSLKRYQVRSLYTPLLRLLKHSPGMPPMQKTQTRESPVIFGSPCRLTAVDAHPYTQKW